jgi:RNA polymerase sigma factor (sigma-70 family)
MNEYRIKVSVRNNLLLSAIEKTGHKSVAAFCRANNIGQTEVSALVSMRDRPVRRNGEFSLISKELMEILGAAPSDLWTDEQLYLKLEHNSGEQVVSRDDIAHFLEQAQTTLTLPSPEDECIRAEISTAVQKALDTRLKPREKAVLQARIWDEKTLEEVGHDLGVHRERVRQLEAKALRKLRYGADRIRWDANEEDRGHAAIGRTLHEIYKEME